MTNLKNHTPFGVRGVYKGHNCRPDDFLLLETKKVKTKYGKRTFDYAAPRLWNALPPEVRKEEDLQVFKKLVKTLLFVVDWILARKLTIQ